MKNQDNTIVELSVAELAMIAGSKGSHRLPETEIAKSCFRDHGAWWSREYEQMKLGFQVPCDLK